MLKNYPFFFILLTLSACGHSPAGMPVYQELNTGQPSARIIKVPYKNTGEFTRSMTSRQFVISNNPPEESPLERAIHIELFAVNNGVQIKPHKKNTDDTSLTINFDLDSYVLPPESIMAVNQFINESNQKGIHHVKITGYSCWLGSDQYNQALALNRAKAVASIFEKAGFKVTANGKGKCCYIDRQRPEPNRRVEISTTEVALKGGEQGD